MNVLQQFHRISRPKFAVSVHIGGIRNYQRSCGLVGLPNVGKSTLFNALTQTQLAQAANYPFCTIEPNSAKVSIPDRRLQRLGEICQSERTVPAQIEFVGTLVVASGARLRQYHTALSSTAQLGAFVVSITATLHF